MDPLLLDPPSHTMASQSALPSLYSCRNTLQGASPSKHIRSSSDIGKARSPSTDSLTFHDHYLGRVATHKLTRSPTLDGGSKIGAAVGTAYGHWNKLSGHSPLLGRTEASAAAGSRSTSVRDKKWKPVALSQPTTPTESLR